MLTVGQQVTLLNGQSGTIVEVYVYKGEDGAAGLFQSTTGTKFVILASEVRS